MKKTPLHASHLDLNAKMAEFAGYDMPIQYPDGVMAEHNWTRESCGLFDVSHMGQVTLEGTATTEFLEKLTPSTFNTLKDGKAKYSVLTNEDGGMVDDLIVTRISENKFFAVINAGCKDKDIEWMTKYLPQGVVMSVLDTRALVAIQGPKAEEVVKRVLNIDTNDQAYMSYAEHESDFGLLFVSRLGYTGEDGFEISVLEDKATDLWNSLLADEAVRPIGLAARDSLRLEMGYPLYGHDIDASTSPIEADIEWIMGKKANTNFIGAERVMKEAEQGANRKRVGVKITGRGVAREGAEILTPEGQKIGVLTSGGFSPTLQQAIGQGYVETAHAEEGKAVNVNVRGCNIEAMITSMPFVEAKTKKPIKQNKAA
ncbi:MAG: glycine cleavage system aminomethyltransferase GcvT [Pseudomonadota bacterium]